MPKLDCIPAIALFMSSVSFTVLAPGCFVIVIRTAFSAQYDAVPIAGVFPVLTL